MAWYTNGSRPSRNLQAAVLSAAGGFLEALASGKPRPGIHAATKGAASFLAMDERRRVDRARANDAYLGIADQVADALNLVLDATTAPTTKQIAGGPANIQPSQAYAVVRDVWERTVATYGEAPARIEIPTRAWQSMHASEQSRLTVCANRDGVQLVGTDSDRVVARPRRTSTQV